MKSYLHSPSQTLFTRCYLLHYLVLSYLPSTVNADNAYSWEPSVSLAADLDEPLQVGYCIDIFGWSGSLNCNLLKARSCKSNGDDTQFEYHAPTKAIRSVNYNTDCNKISSSSNKNRGCAQVSVVEEGATLFMGECDETSEKQIFEIVAGGSSDSHFEFHVGSDLCLVVSETSHIPGPGAPPNVLARDFFLSECDAVPVDFKTWTVAPIPEITNITNTDSAPTVSPSTNPTLQPSNASFLVNILCKILSITL